MCMVGGWVGAGFRWAFRWIFRGSGACNSPFKSGDSPFESGAKHHTTPETETKTKTFPADNNNIKKKKKKFAEAAGSETVSQLRTANYEQKGKGRKGKEMKGKESKSVVREDIRTLNPPRSRPPA